MIKVLLLEKNTILVEAITKGCNTSGQIDLVKVVCEGNECVEFLNNNTVDVIVMDYLQTSGLVTTQSIKKKFPHVKIIGFSTASEDLENNRMLNLGAFSCLSKYDTTLHRLIDEIKIAYNKKLNI